MGGSYCTAAMQGFISTAKRAIIKLREELTVL